MYSSVTVLCCTCGSKIVPGQWPVGHVQVTNKVGIVNNFLEGCVHVKDVGIIWQCLASSAQDTRTEEE